MSIGGVTDPDAVDEAAWRRTARDCAVNGQLLIRDLRALALRVRECAEAVARTALAERWHRPVIDEIRAVIDSRATLYA